MQSDSVNLITVHRVCSNLEEVSRKEIDKERAAGVKYASLGPYYQDAPLVCRLTNDPCSYSETCQVLMKRLDDNSKHTEDLHDLSMKLRDNEEKCEAAYNADLEQLRVLHEQEILRLHRIHEKNITDIKMDHADEVDRLKFCFSTEIEHLQKQIDKLRKAAEIENAFELLRGFAREIKYRFLSSWSELFFEPFPGFENVERSAWFYAWLADNNISEDELGSILSFLEDTPQSESRGISSEEDVLNALDVLSARALLPRDTLQAFTSAALGGSLAEPPMDYE